MIDDGCFDKLCSECPHLEKCLKDVPWFPEPPKRVRIYYYRKFPLNTKSVARPSRWGNPYKLGSYTLEESLKEYRKWLKDRLEKNPDFLKPLLGFDLGCFCKLTNDCHADIILEILYGRKENV